MNNTEQASCTPKPKRPLRRRILILLLILAMVGFVGFEVVYHRVLKAGFAEVVPGEVYRSGQVSSTKLTKLVDRYGFKTVLSLRGEATDEMLREARVCDELGVDFLAFPFSKWRLPSREQLLGLIDALETAPKPLLLHCRGGVDRSGMASAVAALLDGQGLQEALRQAPLVRANSNSAHICDMLAQYRDYCRDEGDVFGATDHFKGWVAEVYEGHPVASSTLAVGIYFWKGNPVLKQAEVNGSASPAVIPPAAPPK